MVRKSVSEIHGANVKLLTATHSACCLNLLINLRLSYLFLMNFQFRQRTKVSSDTDEYEKEITLLKGLNQALEKENDTRNEERKALQA